jgi:hypothetical protein
MFRAKTIFVLGAGASVEVGLPIGEELLRQISKMVDIKFQYNRHVTGDDFILAALRLIVQKGEDVDELNHHIRAGWQLGKSAKQAMSIDNVIDALEDERATLVGKLGIVRAILAAESHSAFFKPPEDRRDGLALDKFAKTWYRSLTKLLTENVRKSGIPGIFENVEIVNFNYDRCLEHYIPHSLSDYYGVPPDEIRNAMRSLIIHRPYGTVGRLPWQLGDGPSVGFGESNAEQISRVVQQIRTFTERIEEGAQLEAMRSSIAMADRIIFLGFAFHRQNVELLRVNVKDEAEIIATAVGISESDRTAIGEELSRAFGYDGDGMAYRRADLANFTCADFFQEYWRTLTSEPPA